MPNLSKEDIERIKNERMEEAKKGEPHIGILVSKNYHNKDCKCDNCLTNPESFCPFPEEHKKFVDGLFEVVVSRK